MEKTIIKEKMKPELKKPVLIEGLPGLGMVGRIATRYLIKQLKAKKLAELYSPHFPYYVLVNKKGSVRLLRGEFYFWKNETGENDLILLTGDHQAQTIEGQYNVSSCILDFAEKYGVKMAVTIGGYRKEAEETPKVVAVSTNPKLLDRALQAEAVVSPAGNPIVGTAGLLLGLARFRNIDALCLLGETCGYLRDPRAAKSVLYVLQKILGLKVDLSGLEGEIEKSDEIVEKMRKIEKRREAYAQKMRQMEEERITYIS
ncbi:proteasome assembly chaperone family protein [Candidatus Bathyarchaeota archaeon]|nr:proteasome assembly chaperone family protein [Candidatus Bathyarchaeota archaeon]